MGDYIITKTNKKLVVQDVLDQFKMRVLVPGRPKTTYIYSSGVARIGIELASDLKPHYKKQTNIILLGASERNYFRSLTDAQLKKCIAKIKKLNPPLIIVNSSFKPEDNKRCQKFFGRSHSTTVATIDMDSSAIYFILSPYVARKLAPSSQVHATLVSIYGCGVLVTGDSGCGKSEAAMELIKAGHLFVGDDAIEIYNFGQALYGHPSEIAKQFIEVRGLGVLDVGKVFGRQKTLLESRVNMIVHLVNPDTSKSQLNNFERVGNKQHYADLMGVKIPKYYIPVTAGRPTASLIESAVVDYKLKRDGYNSGKEYLQNFNRVIKEGNK